MAIIEQCNKKYDNYYKFMFGSRGITYGLDTILDRWNRNLRVFNKKNSKIGLYLHIPYCRNLCYFCDCISKLGAPGEIAIFTDLLINEIKEFAKVFRGVKFDSLYFGGGTPSILSENDLSRLLEVTYNSFNLRGVHSSFEGCPQTLSGKKLEILSKYDFTRLTIGVQSFDGRVLNLNNRLRATEKLIKDLVDKSKSYGILVNLELICGLEGQVLSSFLNDVKKALMMKPDQIHLYHLLYNPMTLAWYRKPGRRAELKEWVRWRTIGLEMLRKADYSFFPFSGPAKEFNAINVQIYNNRVYGGSVLGLGEGALSNINNNFRYAGVLREGGFTYKRVLKQFIKYSEVFNY